MWAILQSTLNEQSRPAEYVKMWVLEDCADDDVILLKGDTTFWRIEHEDGNGDLLVSRGGKKHVIFKHELDAGEVHFDPGTETPFGVHLGVERGYDRNWYGRTRKREVTRNA